MNNIFNCNAFNIKSHSTLVGFIFVLTLGCAGEERERPDVVKEKANNTENTNQPTNNTASPSTDLSSINNSGGGDVQHYICPNNCEGSGGASQGTCPVCGTDYVHNQAFHNQGNQSQMNLEGGDKLQDLQQQQPASVPAQNDAGEYHYICSAGCSGGSGSQGTCSQCGAQLSHNQAYHN
jgi:hypothetical protein